MSLEKGESFYDKRVDEKDGVEKELIRDEDVARASAEAREAVIKSQGIIEPLVDNESLIGRLISGQKERKAEKAASRVEKIEHQNFDRREKLEKDSEIADKIAAGLKFGAITAKEFVSEFDRAFGDVPDYLDGNNFVADGVINNLKIRFINYHGSHELYVEGQNMRNAEDIARFTNKYLGALQILVEREIVRRSDV